MHFDTSIWLPKRRDEVFGFFADAGNLQQITPPWLHFRILTPTPIVIGRGTRIDYRLRLHGIPMRWQSEITVWDPPQGFVDVQRRGPYKSWVHTHEFVDDHGGTTVRDSVEFEIPLGVLLSRFVRRDVERIFAFRTEALVQRFGARRL